MHGLRTKLGELRCNIVSSSESYDVIILVKTWLNDGFHDPELGLTDYKIFRTDRYSDNSSFLRGEDVLIAVHEKFSSRIITVTEKSVEHLFVDVVMGQGHLIVGAVYFPPGSDVDIYESHCHAIEEIYV